MHRLRLLLLLAALAAAAPGASRLDGVDLKHLYGYVIANHVGSLGNNILWPEGALPEGAPFRIGVLGEDPSGGLLGKFFEKRKLKGRALTVIRASEPGALADCQIIFVNNPTAGVLRDLGTVVAGRPVLTIVFSPNQQVRGGQIELHLLKDGSLRFTLDIPRLQAAQLVPSPGLLQLALRAPPP